MLPPIPIAAFDVGLKATLVLAVAALVAWLLQRRSAATRHLVWTLGVTAALLIPGLRLLGPRWELPVLPAEEAAVSRWTPSLSPAATSVALAPSAPSPGTTAASPVAIPGRQAPAVSGATLLFLAWLAGLAAVATPLLAAAARVWWLGRTRPPFGSPAWAALAAEIAGALGIRRRVRLLRGRPQSMPMAFGLTRPVVLLPEEAEEWGDERRRAVLTHELAHVSRHDCLTQALAQAACALYWFHPLAWLAASRLRRERERACDDLVLSYGASGPEYAEQLLELARAARGAGQPAWAVAMARSSELEGRLLAILDPALRRRGLSRRGAAIVAAAALLLIVLVAGLDVVARPALAARPAAGDDLAKAAESLPQATEAEAPAPVPTRTAVAPQPRTEIETERETGAPQGEAPEPGPQDEGEHRHRKSGAASPKVVAALTGALSDTDAEVRQQAVFSLGQMRAAESVEPLTRALADSDAEVRQQAAFALGEIRSAAAVPALTAALRDAEDEVRQQAVFALGQIRAESAVGALVAATKDKSAEVRQQAAFALGQIRSREAVPALVAALKDASGEVRGQAAFALGELGDATASDALVAALKDTEAEVRRQAAFALGQLER